MYFKDSRENFTKRVQMYKQHVYGISTIFIYLNHCFPKWETWHPGGAGNIQVETIVGAEGW